MKRMQSRAMRFAGFPKNPKATTVVVGCYSQISANEVAMVDGVDYVIGNHDKLNFLDYLSEEKPDTPVVVRERIDREDFSIGLVGEAKFEQRANLKIQDGCDFMCSFCIIPFARGRARSREWEDLVADARQMIDTGCKGTCFNWGKPRNLPIARAMTFWE
jgi:threonylcarbamoyladenosine tRNA methylthiotransferase MtaB